MLTGANTLPGFDQILRDNPGFLEEALDTAATSRLTGIPVSTLNTWRCRGGGPRFMKFGKAVRYRRRTVLEWMAECEAPYTDKEGRIHRP